MTPLLEMRSIHKSFYGVKVLQDVPLTLYKGEVLHCWAKTAQANLP